MPPLLPPLYPILDVACAAANGHDLLRCAAGFAALGFDLQQLRAKQLPAGEFLALARRLASVVPRLIVNDRVDIARLAGAAGVHLGQDDVPPAAARPLLAPGQWLGVSTHSCVQLAADADYCAIGPVFETRTKERPDPVVGVETVRAARTLFRGPLVAIGGIDAGNAAAVWSAGADSVAVIAALWCAPDPVEAAHGFRLAFERVSCHSPRE